jgi:hypothetical protein
MLSASFTTEGMTPCCLYKGKESGVVEDWKPIEGEESDPNIQIEVVSHEARGPGLPLR